MKFCQKCGAQLNDDAVFCTTCGSSLANTSTQTTVGQQPTYQPTTKTVGKHNGLSMTAFVCFIIFAVIFFIVVLDDLSIAYFGFDTFWFFIGALMNLSGAISLQKSVKTGVKLSKAHKIACLIMCNLISGIVQLCDQDH